MRLPFEYAKYLQVLDKSITAKVKNSFAIKLGPPATNNLWFVERMDGRIIQAVGSGAGIINGQASGFYLCPPGSAFPLIPNGSHLSNPNAYLGKVPLDGIQLTSGGTSGASADEIMVFGSAQSFESPDLVFVPSGWFIQALFVCNQDNVIGVGSIGRAKLSYVVTDLCGNPIAV